MMFPSHLVVAAAGFAVYIHAVTDGQFQWQLSFELVAGFALVMLGAMLPDIDHPDSTVGKRVKWLSYPIRMVFGHRGITHSLFAVMAMLWCAYAANNIWLSWLALGYLLHLVGDYLTDSGIPLLYPISRKRYRFLITGTTNGLTEPIMVCAVVFGAAAYIF